MTIQDFYNSISCNYFEARKRIPTDALLVRFVNKFTADPSMQNLRDALSEGNLHDAFRAAHTLKGVCANLAFTTLSETVSLITEQLRPETQAPDPALLETLEKEYAKITAAISGIA